MVCITGEILFEEADFSFANGYQLVIVSGLELGFVPISPLASWLLSSIDLCKPCLYHLSISEFMCILVLLCYKGFVSLVSTVAVIVTSSSSWGL